VDRPTAERELASVYTELSAIGDRLDRLRPQRVEIDRLRSRAQHLRRRSRELRGLIALLRDSVRA